MPVTRLFTYQAGERIPLYLGQIVLQHANAYVHSPMTVHRFGTLTSSCFRLKNTLFIPFLAGLISCAVSLIQCILAAWRKHRENVSYEATPHIVKSGDAYSGRFTKLSKFADEHGGLLILACKVERFLGSAGLLGLSLYDLVNEPSHDFVGGVSLESRNLQLLGLVVTYVSCLLLSIV